jgi:hypothetical protein
MVARVWKAIVRLWRGRGTRRLIVLRVDFPMSAEKLQVLDQQMAPLRQKFGLDFIVLEPGMTLSRFNDI